MNLFRKFLIFFTKTDFVYTDKKDLKNHITDTGYSVEWDFNSDVTRFKFLKILYAYAPNKNYKKKLKKDIERLKSKLITDEYDINF